VPRLLFDYDETPLLRVDGSEIDFVDDRATSKTCFAKSTAPSDGLALLRCAQELAAQELFRMNHCARVQIIPRKP
jgi:hypothetical protein